MTIEDIRSEYWKEPFRPFAVHMDDGRRIPVTKPEYVALGPLGRTIAVCTPDNDFHVLAVTEIKEIERNIDVTLSEDRNA